MRERQKQFLLLQINDALFPIGGYSHSYGLETYIQKGMVSDQDTAEKYIKNTLIYNTCYTDILSVRLAYQFAKEKKLKELIDLSAMLTAVKSPREIRQASLKLGSRFIKTVKTFKTDFQNGIFSQYTQSGAGTAVHHSIAYGVFCASAEISEKSTLEAFLYAQVSAMVTNCVKTIPLSQTAGQQMLFDLHHTMQQVLKKADTLTVTDLGKSAPGFDIRGMQHETLYSRLYMS